jgi:hypothetical protein
VIDERRYGLERWSLPVKLPAYVVVMLALVAAVPAHASSLDPATDRLFAAALAHRVAAVSALRPQFRAKMHVWTLAAYVADPQKNAASFVDGFPTTAGGIRDDYGYLWLGGALGGVNPYGTLATLANHGNQDALHKLSLAAGLVPDGFIGAELQNDLAHVAQTRPAETLSAIAALPADVRDHVTAGKVAWCESGAAILHVRTGGDAADAQRRISATIDAECPSEK